MQGLFKLHLIMDSINDRDMDESLLMWHKALFLPTNVTGTEASEPQRCVPTATLMALWCSGACDSIKVSVTC